jgi:hypothetical protein
MRDYNQIFDILAKGWLWFAGAAIGLMVLWAAAQFFYKEPGLFVICVILGLTAASLWRLKIV